MSRNPGSGVLIGQPLRTGVLCTLPSRRAHCPYRGPDAHVSRYQRDSGVQSTEDTSLDAGKRTEYINTFVLCPDEDKLKLRGRDALLVCPWFRLLAHYWHEQGRHSEILAATTPRPLRPLLLHDREQASPCSTDAVPGHGSCLLSFSPIMTV